MSNMNFTDILESVAKGERVKISTDSVNESIKIKHRLSTFKSSYYKDIPEDFKVKYKLQFDIQDNYLIVYRSGNIVLKAEVINEN